jgi:hypothetical protein
MEVRRTSIARYSCLASTSQEYRAGEISFRLPYGECQSINDPNLMTLRREYSNSFETLRNGEATTE